MSTGALFLAALLKIVFILLVVMAAFAPLLVWAERRQSAMIQDRVGPSRAGIPLSKSIRDFMSSTVAPMQTGALLAKLGAGACLLAYVLIVVFSMDGLGPLTGNEFILGAVALFLLSGGLAFGSAMHKGWAETGKIRLLGTLHSAADAAKMVFKEDFRPPKADILLFNLAPVITVIPAIAAFTVIPFGDALNLELLTEVMPRDGGGAVGTNIPLQIASLNVGVLFLFAIASTGIIGAAIGGYASDNKYSLMGGIRAASQMVSYEVALGLTIVPCFMLYGTLRLEEMINWQYNAGLWGIAYPPLTLAFILYFTSAIAETKRVPFDAPEGESELVGGYLTEYSGMKFGMFFTAEFVEVVALSALATVIFFGGWDVPFLFRDGFDFGEWSAAIPGTSWVLEGQILLQHWAVVAIQVLAFILKIVGFVFIQLSIRWALPRFRYDQIMMLCWKGILPLALINILITGVFVLFWN